MIDILFFINKFMVENYGICIEIVFKVLGLFFYDYDECF